MKRLITAVLFCSLLLSGCGDSSPSETITETTEQTTVTTPKYTEEELEQLAQNMPEIVFVMSHHYEGSNIRGVYVTNTGEVKMYDFNNLAPSETYDIAEVYDKIEEAECSELYINDFYTLTQEDMFTVPKSTMLNYYKTLLKSEENIYCQKSKVLLHNDDYYGKYNYYGIKIVNEKTEVVFLSGYDSRFDYYNDNIYLKELDDKLKSEIFSIYIPRFTEETD